MEKWKKEYEDMRVPDEMKDRIEGAVKRAQEEKKKVRKVRIFRTMTSAAAVLAIVLILPNTSQAAAAAMQQIPLIGDFFKVVTVREYNVDEERNYAEVKVPEIVPDEAVQGSIKDALTPAEEAAAAKAKESAEEINFDIQKVTDELIAEFEASVEEHGEEGYQDLYIDSEVLTDSDRWFSLKLVLYQGAGSGYECQKHYTIDKMTGARAALADFYGADYVTVISEEIKTQMREQMAEDEMVVYWIDDEEIPEWNFEAIAEDQDFYVNADGHVVICFDEYEVAPGYMGCVEFVLSK